MRVYCTVYIVLNIIGILLAADGRNSTGASLKSLALMIDNFRKDGNILDFVKELPPTLVDKLLGAFLESSARPIRHH
ncbi:unnamed protein product, partial [Adineta ricciae]